MLEVKDVFYHAGRLAILKGVSASFRPGVFSMILGPNGSGKSTLMKVLSGDHRPRKGTVYYGPLECRREHFKKLSLIRAVMPQHTTLSFPLTVEEVVMMGRYPHFHQRPSMRDREICDLALHRLRIGHFRRKNYLTLSGGERQRVHFAKTLAQLWGDEEQGTKYLLLDEPIASLDPNYQHEFLSIAREWAEKGTVVVAVMHDVNLAAQYGDHFLALKQGEVMAAGNRTEVMNPGTLSSLYGMGCTCLERPGLRSPYFIFDPSGNEHRSGILKDSTPMFAVG